MPAIAAIGVGLQVLGAGKNIVDSIRQRKIAKDAERAAAEAVEDARRKLEINRMEELQVPLESYTQAMRENTAQQMQNIQALQEAGTRTLLGGVGRVQGIAAAGTEGQRQAMEQALAQRDQLIAKEQSRLDAAQANLSLSEATGLQQMASDATEASSQLMSSGISGLGNAALTAYQASELYNVNKTKRDALKSLRGQGMFEGMSNAEAIRQMESTMGPNQILKASQGMFVVPREVPGIENIVKPSSDFTMNPSSNIPSLEALGGANAVGLSVGQ
jgi:DNA-binding transcriptional MerR regulator